MEMTPAPSPRRAREKALDELFRREQDTLAQAEAALADPAADASKLRHHMEDIAQGYRRLLRQSMKVTSVGDATQLQLLRTSQELADALEKVAKLNEDLQAMQREKDEIFAMTVHDLKSPLSGIQGLASIIENPELSESHEHRQMGGEIHGLTDNMLAMINDLVDIYQLEAGSMPIRPTTVTLGNLKDRIQSDLGGHARKKRIMLHFRLHDPNLVVNIDVSHWLRAVTNLVSNAIKYSPPGTTVSVSLGLFERRLLLSVGDQGPGISAVDQQKLFRKFAKLSARPTGGESSSGLGLAIVKRIVDGLGGRVWCESDLGRGSVFHVEVLAELPAAEA